MTEYVVKLAFLLRAWGSVTIKADADAEPSTRLRLPRNTPWNPA